MNKLSHLNIKQIFAEGFSARDLAESLISFDDDMAAGYVSAKMVEQDYDVAGVRQEGLVTGYVRKNELGEGACGDFMHLLEDADILPDSASFSKVIKALIASDFAFVSVFGSVGGIVTRTDLRKPPMRMWLFGMITIMEMEFVRMIQSRYPDGGWRKSLSAPRLQKAQRLYKERRRINQHVSLIDCLQLSDKGRILVKDPESLRKLGFSSTGTAKETFKQIENLRNNLAHSQDIVSHNWEIIVSLCASLDAMFKPPAG